jgi:hypothetical protein
VGPDGSPDFSGETTLDALLCDGATEDVGAVAYLRRIPSAISAARAVMHYTRHSLLAGDGATALASYFGGQAQTNLTYNNSDNAQEILAWRAGGCQPNFYDPAWALQANETCGPYGVRPMPAPTPDELWQLLVRTRLLAPDAVAALRADHAAAVATGGDGSTKGLATWLLSRGLITRWQAKRLVIGDTGPFFVGDYRLLERHERDGDGLVFTARHEPTGRLVTLMLLNAKRCRDRDVWASIVARTAAAHATTDPMMARTWSLEQQQRVLCQRHSAVCQQQHHQQEEAKHCGSQCPPSSKQ